MVDWIEMGRHRQQSQQSVANAGATDPLAIDSHRFYLRFKRTVSQC